MTTAPAPIDPNAQHHDIPDHQFHRWLITGAPIRTLCGYTIPAERYRTTRWNYAPLPACPACSAIKAGDLAA